jgi:hypothetical protein
MTCRAYSLSRTWHEVVCLKMGPCQISEKALLGAAVHALVLMPSKPLCEVQASNLLCAAEKSSIAS